MSKETDERLSLIAEIIYLREINNIQNRIIARIAKEEEDEVHKRRFRSNA